MNRRRFFKMAVGVLGALALPVPKVLTNADIWFPNWCADIRPDPNARAFARVLLSGITTPSRKWFTLSKETARSYGKAQS